MPQWNSAKVVIKAGFATNNLANHVHYIQHREKNTEKRELMTENGTIPEKDFIRQVNRAGKKYYKFIISPEDRLSRDELKSVVNEAMKELEKRYGKLTYAFVIHENTSHFHAHVVCAGRSKRRSPVRVTKNTLQDMKEAAINRVFEIKQDKVLSLGDSFQRITESLKTGFKKIFEIK
jgi:type IV secretory pathway VirD2 relaxase